MYYDPMIAKLCTWAPTRIAAVDAMADALDDFVVDGIEHNIPFLSALMQHPRWREGRLSTGFIAEEFPDGFHPIQPDEDDKAVLSTIAVAVELIRRDRLDRLTGRLAPHSGRLKRDWIVKLGADYVAVRVTEGRSRSHRRRCLRGGRAGRRRRVRLVPRRPCLARHDRRQANLRADPAAAQRRPHRLERYFRDGPRHVARDCRA